MEILDKLESLSKFCNSSEIRWLDEENFKSKGETLLAERAKEQDLQITQIVKFSQIA